MGKDLKALEQMLKAGFQAFTKSNGGLFVNLWAGGIYYDVELSPNEINKWAKLYDADKELREVEHMKDRDPIEVLEEVARIFHYRGWDLGDDSSNDTDFINSSDEFLELVSKAFNPYNKK